MPRFAALDLGSNALRLRIVEAHAPAPGREQLELLPEASTSFREVTSVRAPVRLGSEVFVTGRLASASIGQACSALRDFRQAMDAAKVDVYRAVATSAVREASNGATLVERARRASRVGCERTISMGSGVSLSNCSLGFSPLELRAAFGMATSPVGPGELGAASGTFGRADDPGELPRA